jgi:hypothetical protein
MTHMIGNAEAARAYYPFDDVFPFLKRGAGLEFFE